MAEMKDYSVFGIAALLPGMQHMVDLMQEQLDQFREQLEAAQTSKKRIGRPPGSVNKAQGPASFWAKMTPEQRRIEGQRRRAVAMGEAPSQDHDPYRTKAKRKGHPRNPEHPGHEAWLAKLRAAQKKAWAGMSKVQQRAQKARMQAGRRPQVKLVNGAEAVA
jgi:hypothetical protein